MDDSKTLRNIENKLSALIAISALSVSEESDGEEMKLELVLHNAGLENTEIAKILNKKLAAVQKAIQRARK
jgi:hypothetical protein